MRKEIEKTADEILKTNDDNPLKGKIKFPSEEEIREIEGSEPPESFRVVKSCYDCTHRKDTWCDFHNFDLESYTTNYSEWVCDDWA